MGLAAWERKLEPGFGLDLDAPRGLRSSGRLTGSIVERLNTRHTCQRDRNVESTNAPTLHWLLFAS